jgi:hypothetical protein
MSSVFPSFCREEMLSILLRNLSVEMFDILIGKLFSKSDEDLKAEACREGTIGQSSDILLCSSKG